MKYILNLFLILTILGLSSCNNHDEVAPQTPIPVKESYLPQTLALDMDDTGIHSLLQQWYGKDFMVNSPDELPDDPLGFSSSYDNIDFNESTLLVSYHIHTYDIESYRYTYVKNNLDNSYDWTISLGCNGLYDQPQGSSIYLTRFAVLVPKIPAGSSWKVWWSLSNL